MCLPNHVGGVQPASEGHVHRIGGWQQDSGNQGSQRGPQEGPSPRFPAEPGEGMGG